MQAPPTTTTTTPPIRQDGIPAKLVKPWTLPPQKTYVLHNANVVDAANGSIVPRQTVVLRDGLIDSVQPHAQLHPPHPPGVGRRHRGRSRRLLPLPGPHRLATCTSPPLAGSAALGFERGRHGRVLLFSSRFSASRLLSRGFTSVRDTGGATLALKEAIADDVFPRPARIPSQQGHFANRRPRGRPEGA
ncbi:hypothetical protein ACQRIU_006816 [Beauveria bassiana]